MHLQQEELLLLWDEVMRDPNLDSFNISRQVDTSHHLCVTLLAKSVIIIKSSR